MKLKMLDPWKERGLKMVDDVRPPLKLADIRTKRWRKADNGRLLPLNSDAWRKLRKQVLAEEPLCRHCAAQGLTVPATEVDHMRGAADNSRDALQALCKPCHSIKTMAELYGIAVPHPVTPLEKCECPVTGLRVSDLAIAHHSIHEEAV